MALLVSTISTSASAARTPQRLSESERAALCAKAIEEVERGREYVAALEARLATARAQLQAADERAKLSDERASVDAERVRLLGENVALLESSLKLAREQVELLSKDLDRVRAERDAARRSRWRWGAIGAAAGAVLVVLAGRE